MANNSRTLGKLSTIELELDKWLKQFGTAPKQQY
jgi:hypothetical protein